MIRTKNNLTSFTAASRIGDTVENRLLFYVELFVDLANIKRGSSYLGVHEIDYSNFPGVLLQEYARRLGIAGISSLSPEISIDLLDSIRIPTAICRRVWCVTSVPVNFHPDDEEIVRKRRRLHCTLRIEHGFHVKEMPFDFSGYHVSRKARKSSPIKEERDWDRQEKGVDVALSVRLMQRCFSSDAPDGIIFVSGDADFGPALKTIIGNRPGIQVMLAAFSSRLSHIYRSDTESGPAWQWPPIILDRFLDEFKYTRRSDPQAQQPPRIRTNQNRRSCYGQKVR